MSSKKLKPETEKQAKERLSKSLNCYIKELDLTHGMSLAPVHSNTTTLKERKITGDLKKAHFLDPWNVNQWKDWEFCQGNYRKIYSIDTNIPRKELYIVNNLVEQMNVESKNKNQFILVDKQPIVFEKKEKYNSLTFYIYDTKSTITREYTVQYKELPKDRIRVINGFRTRTLMEDTVLQTGYNIDNYNQLGQNYQSYYMDIVKPKYYPLPMNPQTYNFSNVPSNLYMESDKMPELAGTFKASLFNN